MSKVREGYLALAETEKNRIKIVPATGSIEEIGDKIFKVVKEALNA